LCTHPDVRATFAAAAVRDVSSRFTWEDVTSSVVTFYETARDGVQAHPLQRAQHSGVELSGGLTA
jgi:hypothetical protein